MNIEIEKNNIGHLFNRIAPSYDRLNHLLTLGIDRHWRHKAVQCLSRETPQVLDVAVGTADMSIAMVLKKKARKVTGVDVSEKMLSLGRDKVIKKGLQEQITLQESDVAALPFEQESFQAVTCAFGVRNFSHRQKGLREMERVLQHGGKLVILEFAYPNNTFIRFLYTWYFTQILPTIGRWVSKDDCAYSYLPASVKEFPYGQSFADELSAVGFENINIEMLSMGVCAIYTAHKK